MRKPYGVEERVQDPKKGCRQQQNNKSHSPNNNSHFLGSLFIIHEKIPEASPRTAPAAMTGHGVRKKQPTAAASPIITTKVSRRKVRTESQVLLSSNVASPSTIADINGNAERSPPAITVARPALLKTPSAVGISPRAIQITLITTKPKSKAVMRAGSLPIRPRNTRASVSHLDLPAPVRRMNRGRLAPRGKFGSPDSW